MYQWELGPYKGPFCYWRMEKKGETKKKEKRGKKVFFTKPHGITSKETALLITMNAGYLIKQNE